MLLRRRLVAFSPFEGIVEVYATAASARTTSTPATATVGEIVDSCGAGGNVTGPGGRAVGATGGVGGATSSEGGGGGGRGGSAGSPGVGSASAVQTERNDCERTGAEPKSGKIASTGSSIWLSFTR